MTERLGTHSYEIGIELDGTCLAHANRRNIDFIALIGVFGDPHNLKRLAPALVAPRGVLTVTLAMLAFIAQTFRKHDLRRSTTHSR